MSDTTNDRGVLARLGSVSQTAVRKAAPVARKAADMVGTGARKAAPAIKGGFSKAREKANDMRERRAERAATEESSTDES